MHYSGIVVVTRPLLVGDCQRELERLPGVEVHYCEPQTGRLVVVQETQSAEEQEIGLRRIQALPGVATAALVEHRIDMGIDRGMGRSTGMEDRDVESSS